MLAKKRLTAAAAGPLEGYNVADAVTAGNTDTPFIEAPSSASAITHDRITRRPTALVRCAPSHRSADGDGARRVGVEPFLPPGRKASYISEQTYTRVVQALILSIVVVGTLYADPAASANLRSRLPEANEVAAGRAAVPMVACEESHVPAATLR